MTWQPVPGHIQTRWARDVSPRNVWPEYPRPQMTRPEWLNLNGLWEYWITDRTGENVRQEGEILVPFPIESALSGVKRPLWPDEFLWYRRTFSIPAEWRGRRVLLHFGAVDWETVVWVNGHEVGRHVGGYLPFWLDITDALREGENVLTVRVWDPTDTYWQQRGKQVLKPRSIWYTAVSGIWQTVWLEPVPQTYIAGLRITPDVDAEAVRVRVSLAGANPDAVRVHLRAWDGGHLVAEGGGDAGAEIVLPVRFGVPHPTPSGFAATPSPLLTKGQERGGGGPKGRGWGEDSSTTQVDIVLPIPRPKLWSPDLPHLYDLEVTAGEDRVGSYFGMRKFSVEGGRLCLNGAPLFQFGPLDQGYWPDGLYTPPTDEALRSDVELIKRLGFNMVRKHVKVEPARYYYYCDQLGLIVWQDMPNGGKPVGDVTSFIALTLGLRRRDRNYRYAGRADPASREDFRRELREMVDALHNFPCIGMWVVFNEGWGQFDAAEIADWLRAYDPTRPVDHASGWFDQGGGDCKSLHVYFKKLPIIRPEEHRAAVLSEFGGYSLKVDGHLWNPAAEFGYRKFRSSEGLTEAYLALLEDELRPLIEAGLSAAVYTQLTDVEIEVNGYVTYDRAVEKMDLERVAAAHRRLLGEFTS